jgi:hypothetical protein
LLFILNTEERDLGGSLWLKLKNMQKGKRHTLIKFI